MLQEGDGTTGSERKRREHIIASIVLYLGVTKRRERRTPQRECAVRKPARPKDAIGRADAVNTARGRGHVAVRLL